MVVSIAVGMVGFVALAASDAATRDRGLVESAPGAVVELDVAAWLRGDDVVPMGPMNPVAAEIPGHPPEVGEVPLRRTDIPRTFAALLDEVAELRTGATVLSFGRSDRVFTVGWRFDPASGRVVLSGSHHGPTTAGSWCAPWTWTSWRLLGPSSP